jgi:hypothetical protein
MAELRVFCHPSSLLVNREDTEDDESAVVTEIQYKDVVAVITARAAVGSLEP